MLQKFVTLLVSNFLPRPGSRQQLLVSDYLRSTSIINLHSKTNTSTCNNIILRGVTMWQCFFYQFGLFLSVFGFCQLICLVLGSRKHWDPYAKCHTIFKLKIFWSIVDNLRQWSWSWRIKRSESRRTTRKRCTRVTWNIYMYYPLYYDDYIIVFEKYIFTFYICTLCLLQMIKSNLSKFKFWGKLCSVKVSEHWIKVRSSITIWKNMQQGG